MENVKVRSKMRGVRLIECGQFSIINYQFFI